MLNKQALSLIQSAVRYALESEYCDPGMPIKVWHDDPVLQGKGWSYTARMFFPGKYDQEGGLLFLVEWTGGEYITIKEVLGPWGVCLGGMEVWKRELEAAQEVAEELRSQPKLYFFSNP